MPSFLFFIRFVSIAVHTLTRISLAEFFDASSLLLAPDTVDDPFSAALLASDHVDHVDGSSAADVSIFEDDGSSKSISFENSNSLFDSSPNIQDSNNLALADLTSPSDSGLPAYDLFDTTQDTEAPLLYSIADQKTDQGQIAQTSDSALPASALSHNNQVGASDDSHDIAFLDSDTPIIPSIPKIIKDLFPPLNMDPLQLLPNVGPARPRPICEGNYFPFCCLEGPPSTVKKTTVPDPERLRRRRKCYNCRWRLSWNVLIIECPKVLTILRQGLQPFRLVSGVRMFSVVSVRTVYVAYESLPQRMQLIRSLVAGLTGVCT